MRGRLETNPIMKGLSLEMFKLLYKLSESNNTELLLGLMEALASGTTLGNLLLDDMKNALRFAKEDDDVEANYAQHLFSTSSSPLQVLKTIFDKLMLEEKVRLQENIKSLVDEARMMSSCLPPEDMRCERDRHALSSRLPQGCDRNVVDQHFSHSAAPPEVSLGAILCCKATG
eukprot:762972-Hanusia_phi.AAC.7